MTVPSLFNPQVCVYPAKRPWVNVTVGVRAVGARVGVGAGLMVGAEVRAGAVAGVAAGSPG